MKPEKQILEEKLVDLKEAIGEHTEMVKLLEEKIKKPKKAGIPKLEICTAKLDLRKHKSWLKILEDIHEKRHNYFFEHYLPQYEHDTAKCEQNWEQVWKDARQIDEHGTGNKQTLEKIRYLIETYPEKNPDNRQDMRNLFYKSLDMQVKKHLNGGYKR